jgi:hypothetical protein
MAVDLLSRPKIWPATAPTAAPSPAPFCSGVAVAQPVNKRAVTQPKVVTDLNKVCCFIGVILSIGLGDFRMKPEINGCDSVQNCKTMQQASAPLLPAQPLRDSAPAQALAIFQTSIDPAFFDPVFHLHPFAHEHLCPAHKL